MSGLFFVSIFNRAVPMAHTAILIVAVPGGATLYAWIIGYIAGWY
jgi:hypothetical protein